MQVGNSIIKIGKTLIMGIFTYWCIWYPNFPNHNTIQSIREAYEGSRVCSPFLWDTKITASRVAQLKGLCGCHQFMPLAVFKVVNDKSFRGEDRVFCFGVEIISLALASSPTVGIHYIRKESRDVVLSSLVFLSGVNIGKYYEVAHPSERDES